MESRKTYLPLFNGIFHLSLSLNRHKRYSSIKKTDIVKMSQGRELTFLWECSCWAYVMTRGYFPKFFWLIINKGVMLLGCHDYSPPETLWNWGNHLIRSINIFVITQLNLGEDIRIISVIQKIIVHLLGVNQVKCASCYGYFIQS